MLKESKENKNLKEILSEKCSLVSCLLKTKINNKRLIIEYFYLYLRLIKAVHIYLLRDTFTYININLDYRNSSNLINTKVFLLILNVKLASEKQKFFNKKINKFLSIYFTRNYLHV